MLLRHSVTQARRRLRAASIPPVSEAETTQMAADPPPDPRKGGGRLLLRLKFASETELAILRGIGAEPIAVKSSQYRVWRLVDLVDARSLRPLLTEERCAVCVDARWVEGDELLLASEILRTALERNVEIVFNLTRMRIEWSKLSQKLRPLQLVDSPGGVNFEGYLVTGPGGEKTLMIASRFSVFETWQPDFRNKVQDFVQGGGLVRFLFVNQR